MEASAGGFYDLKNFNGGSEGTETFPETKSNKRVCFTLDETKPAHCSETSGSCTSEPLQLSTRLTRQPKVDIHVDGWIDPIPPRGTSHSASDISTFRLEVHGADVGMTKLTVQVNLQSLSVRRVSLVLSPFQQKTVRLPYVTAFCNPVHCSQRTEH